MVVLSATDRARPRRRRRLGCATHRHRHRARRAVRHGGRRVPHPRPERVRRAPDRPVGSGHRPRALRGAGGERRRRRGCARRVPCRYWRKCVAAMQGIVLTVAAAESGPRLFRLVALAVALVLLAVSVRDRGLGAASPARRSAVADRAPGRRRWTARRSASSRSSGSPSSRRTGSAGSRRPHSSGSRSRALVLVALALVLPQRAARVRRRVRRRLLAVLTTLRLLDMGFIATLDRPFDPVNDWGYFGPAAGVLQRLRRSALGRRRAGRCGAARARAARARTAVGRAVDPPDRAASRDLDAGGGTLGVVWALCAAFHVQFATDERRRGDECRPSRRRSGPADPDARSRTSTSSPPSSRARPVGSDAAAAATDRAARQGRPDRLRRELRAGGGAGHAVLRRDRPSPSGQHDSVV